MEDKGDRGQWGGKESSVNFRFDFLHRFRFFFEVDFVSTMAFLQHFSGVLIRYCASRFSMLSIDKNLFRLHSHEFTKSINQNCWHETYATQNTLRKSERRLHGLFISLERTLYQHTDIGFYWHTKWINININGLSSATNTVANLMRLHCKRTELMHYGKRSSPACAAKYNFNGNAAIIHDYVLCIIQWMSDSFRFLFG